MRLLHTLLALLLLASTLQAQALTFAELQQQLQQYPVLRCHYTQEKHLKELDAPLTSEGVLLLSRADGLYWKQQQPFGMTLTATDQSFSQQLEGQSPQVLTRQDNPQLFEIIHTLKALFSGDQEVLEQNFKPSFESNAQSWQLTLIPAREPFALVFSKLRVSGEKFIEKLELFDKAGDLTALYFSAYQTQPESLTADEKAHFAR